MKKSLLIGAAAGLLTFLGMEVMSAQRFFSIGEVSADPDKFYGREVPLSGVIRSPRQSSRYINRQTVPMMTFSLYESRDDKGRWSDRYVSVTLPAEQFRMMPREGDTMNVTGVLKAPYLVGTIEP